MRYIGNTANGLTENTVYYVKTTPSAQSFTLSTTQGGATLTVTTGSGLSLTFATSPYDVNGNPTGHNIAPIWVGDSTTVGGIPAGASTLDELADVTIGVSGLYGIPLDVNQHLQYDGVTNQWRNVNDMIIPGYVNIQSTTDATTKDSGALIVEGGVGIEKALYVGTNLRVGGSTNSTSKDTGALVVQEGGLGVEQNITAGGDVAVNGGDLTTTASTFNIVSTAATVNIGSSAGNVIVAGDLKINGNDIKSSDGSVAITLNGNDVEMPDKLTVANEIVLEGTQPFVSFFRATPVDGVETIRGVRGQVTTDDYWFVGGGSTADDAGYLLIATSDNSGTAGAGEPILVRQYGGDGNTYPQNAPWGTSTPLTREAKLLDENGYTYFPERLGVGVTPTVKLDVNGSARIRGDSLTVDGNLIVNGTTTTINSTTLTVDDKNIELAATATPSDAAADAGGITLKGTTDKNITWSLADNKWHFAPGVVADDGKFGNVTVGDATDNTITTSTGDLVLAAASGVVKSTNKLEVVADLEVTGAVQIHDNFPVLNYGVTGAPSTNAGIAVNRGTSADVNIRWNESTDRWESTVDGTNYIKLPNQDLDTGNTPTFGGATLGDITVGVATDGTITTSTGTLAITAANSTVDITGDTTVIGNFRTTDNIIRLNYDVDTGAPSESAGIAVRRGSSTDAQWFWDETYDWWTNKMADNSVADIFSSGKLIANSDLATNGRHIIFNNDDATPTNTDDMTLLVKRGTSADVSIVWDETNDRWKFTNDGTNYVKFANQDLDTGNEPTFGALTLDTVTK